MLFLEGCLNFTHLRIRVSYKLFSLVQDALRWRINPDRRKICPLLVWLKCLSQESTLVTKRDAGTPRWLPISLPSAMVFTLSIWSKPPSSLMKPITTCAQPQPQAKNSCLSAPNGKLQALSPKKLPGVVVTTSTSDGWVACSPTGPRSRLELSASKI